MDRTERQRWRVAVDRLEQAITRHVPFGLDTAGEPLLVGQLVDDDRLPHNLDAPDYQAYVAREHALLEYCWSQVSQKGDGATLRELKLFVCWVRLAKEQALDSQDFVRLYALRDFEKAALSRFSINTDLQGED